ncbi:MAG TPA: GGDEF domain-containing protein [Devosia sp.]|nr:GGDEF domain-containing protein [Devosia sp.]
MSYIVITLFAVFAGTFGILARMLPALSYLRFFALAFLACGIGIAIQVTWLPPDINANPLLATGMYVSGALLFAEGGLRRSGQSMGRAFHLFTFTALILATAWFLFVSRDTIARTYILSFGFGFILLCAAWRGRALVRGTIADRLLFWTFVVVGLHFFPRTVMTASSLAGAGANYSTTPFWIVLQYALALFATVGALVLVAVTGFDIITALRRERDTDLLTGVLNRRGLEQAVEALPAPNRASPLSVMIADLDDFKAINDANGHAAGDAVLRAVAGRLKHNVRKGDLVARIGGEEFVCLTPGTVDEARLLADRLRLAIADTPITVDGKVLTVTASLGVASFDPAESFWDSVRNADRALYASKRSGKNTVNVG